MGPPPGLSAGTPRMGARTGSPSRAWGRLEADGGKGDEEAP